MQRLNWGHANSSTIYFTAFNTLQLCEEWSQRPQKNANKYLILINIHIHRKLYSKDGHNNANTIISYINLVSLYIKCPNVASVLLGIKRVCLATSG